MTIRFRSLAVFFLLLCSMSELVIAATVQSPNGFDSGEADGWVAGRAFANPVVKPDGGPNGDGDPFLEVTASGGNGPGSIIAAFNDEADWVGDFKTSGITSLSVDMMNPVSSSSLDMRLVLFGPDSNGNRWTSADSISVANDGAWRNYIFPIDESSLIRVQGTSSIDEVLGNAKRIMLRHDSGAPSAGGSSVRAVLRIDNIGFLAGVFGDYNGNGQIDIGDLDVQAAGMVANDPTFDLDGDGDADVDDRFNWIRNVQKSWMGDSSFDGEFSSSDFVLVFSIGRYETEQIATYAEGDWNGDLRFDSSDFVVAFQDGGFEKGPRPALTFVPEPTSSVPLLFGILSGVPLFLRRD